MSYINIKNFRIRLKERSIYVLGDKCQCCGYNKCIQALEFHHLNPTEKSFSFCENTNRSWEKTKEELKKCILVCANCHREIHAGVIDNNNLSSSFNEERALEIDNIVQDLKTHKLYYCQYCGVEVSSGNNCCPSCANLRKRKVERPDRNQLKYLIRNKSFVSIAKDYGVTDNAIRKWCIKENLPYKSKEIKSYSNEEWEKI